MLSIAMFNILDGVKKKKAIQAKKAAEAKAAADAKAAAEAKAAEEVSPWSATTTATYANPFTISGVHPAAPGVTPGDRHPDPRGFIPRITPETRGSSPEGHRIQVAWINMH